RLIDEAETVAGQVSECRARRTQPAAAIQDTTSGTSMSSIAVSIIANVIVIFNAVSIT
ncbi:hypothetical protein GCK32_022370, partial [Trichostrongylus colubriformis]